MHRPQRNACHHKAASKRVTEIVPTEIRNFVFFEHFVEPTPSIFISRAFKSGTHLSHAISSLFQLDQCLYNQDVGGLIEDYERESGKAMKDWDARDFKAFAEDVKAAGGDTRDFLDRLYAQNPEAEQIVESAEELLQEMRSSEAAQTLEQIGTEVVEACEEGGCEIL